MFADDNFPPSSNSDLDTLITELKNKLNTITKWLRDSGLKINEEKTELCLLHRNDHTPITIMINNTTIQLYWNCTRENGRGVTCFQTYVYYLMSNSIQQ